MFGSLVSVVRYRVTIWRYQMARTGASIYPGIATMITTSPVLYVFIYFYRAYRDCRSATTISCLTSVVSALVVGPTLFFSNDDHYQSGTLRGSSTSIEPTEIFDRPQPYPA
ncbi:hypothetical protein J6590_076348 [Homalodisca vitripennis]|nr:hypothetical protein J6590_076348 [Homalodisca vitripennis]